MTTERAMRLAEKWADGLVCSLREGEATEYHKMFLSMLRAQQKAENNAPLTLDELREMDGDKIYIKFIGVLRGFYDDEYAPYYGQHEQYIQKYNGMLRACDLPLRYYGESWLAYRRKPEEPGL